MWIISPTYLINWPNFLWSFSVGFFTLIQRSAIATWIPGHAYLDSNNSIAINQWNNSAFSLNSRGKYLLTVSNFLLSGILCFGTTSGSPCVLIWSDRMDFLIRTYNRIKIIPNRGRSTLSPQFSVLIAFLKLFLLYQRWRWWSMWTCRWFFVICHMTEHWIIGCMLIIKGRYLAVAVMMYAANYVFGSVLVSTSTAHGTGDYNTHI